jgi:metal-responsive CopG/Arc/MetJ family transcriptional regulator
MANITLSLPEELYQKLKDHPEIRWSEIARKAIQHYLDDLELLDKLTTNSSLTDDDVRELSDLIDTKVVERLSKYQSK